MITKTTKAAGRALRTSRLSWYQTRVCLAIAGGLILPLVALSDVREALVRIGTMNIPSATSASPMTSFDISLVDVKRDLYLLSDASHKSVVVFRASTGEFLFSVPGFFGTLPPGHAHNGPTSIIVVEDQIWAGDNPSRIRVIDLNSTHIIETIAVPGTARVDGLAYDPTDHVVLAANPNEDNDAPPFVTFVSTAPGHAILAKIVLPMATDWVEAIEWSPDTRLFYVAIPELDGKPDHGGVAVVDPRKRALIQIFPLNNCRPNGLALGHRGEMLVGCQGEGLGKKYNFRPRSFLMNLRTGVILTQIDGVTGSDQIVYDSGDDRYYLAAEANPGGPAVVAVNASGEHTVLKASTDKSAHSVAADSQNNHIFVPLGPMPTDSRCRNGCIGIYAVTKGTP
jgi:hypothetical protein